MDNLLSGCQSTDMSVFENLGNNIRALREGRGMSQAQMAAVSGVPRPTWSNLESGAANPTLAVLVKVADALHVRLEELLGPPRSAARFFAKDQLRTRSSGGVTIRRLLPDDVPGLDIERMEFPPGARMTGIPHTDGTREYLTCERGEIELFVAGQSYRLEPGDVVVFRGDQRHGYRNAARKVTVAYSVIAFAPLGGG